MGSLLFQAVNIALILNKPIFFHTEKREKPGEMAILFTFLTLKKQPLILTIFFLLLET
jgi:hypothetical protein